MARAPSDLKAANATVPEHVVYRSFADEIVALNLESGIYHSLNQTAARMMELATSQPTVGDAIGPLVDELDADEETIESDLLELCASLEERGLIELSDAPA